MIYIENEAIPLVALRWQRIVIGLGKSRHRQTLLECTLLWNETYSESRIELRNLQISKKMLNKSSQFLSSEQLTEAKSLDVALNNAGAEKIGSENLLLRSTWRPSDSSFERIGALVTGKFESSVVCDSQISLK